MGFFSNRVDQNHKNFRPDQFFSQFLDTKYEDELGQLKSIHKTATIRSFCGFGLSRWKRSCFSIPTLTGYGKKALMRSPPQLYTVYKPIPCQLPRNPETSVLSCTRISGPYGPFGILAPAGGIGGLLRSHDCLTGQLLLIVFLVAEQLNTRPCVYICLSLCLYSVFAMIFV